MARFRLDGSDEIPPESAQAFRRLLEGTTPADWSGIMGLLRELYGGGQAPAEVLAQVLAAPMGTKEAAALLGVSQRTVKRWIKAGKIAGEIITEKARNRYVVYWNWLSPPGLLSQLGQTLQGFVAGAVPLRWHEVARVLKEHHGERELCRKLGMAQRDRQTQEPAPSTIFRWIRGKCYPGLYYRARLFGLICEPLEDGESLLEKHSDSLWAIVDNNPPRGHW